MPARLPLLALALLICACAGCCEQRVWLCDEGNCGLLSGRFEDGSNCHECNTCGQQIGNCRCGFFANLHRRLTCGQACGEMYFGDWISDPPAPCDPCDECTGEFVGRRCCPPRKPFLLGGRYCDGDCPQGQCRCRQ